MKLSNLSKALQPHNVADFADVEITPGVFSVKVIEVSHLGQQWQVRAAEYCRIFEKSSITEVINQFFAGEVNDDTLHLLTNAVIVDWELHDDKGAKLPYDAVQAAELFKSLPRIASKLMHASLTQSFFSQEWTQLALKN